MYSVNIRVNYNGPVWNRQTGLCCKHDSEVKNLRFTKYKVVLILVGRHNKLHPSLYFNCQMKAEGTVLTVFFFAHISQLSITAMTSKLPRQYTTTMKLNFMRQNQLILNFLSKKHTLYVWKGSTPNL